VGGLTEVLEDALKRTRLGDKAMICIGALERGRGDTGE
jgi:hypothetical protein